MGQLTFQFLHAHNPGNLTNPVGFLSRHFRRSVTPVLLTSWCSFACQGETAPPPQKEAVPPGGQPASVSAPPQARSSDVSNERQSGTTPPKAVTQTQKPTGRSRSQRGIPSFAVYTLSRGNGVPEAARAAQQEVQKLVEADRDRGLVVSIETTRIGLEGERRLCVTYKDPRTGARAFERARAIVKGVALVNLVAEPCTPPASKTPKQEETA